MARSTSTNFNMQNISNIFIAVALMNLISDLMRKFLGGYLGNAAEYAIPLIVWWVAKKKLKIKNLDTVALVSFAQNIFSNLDLAKMFSGYGRLVDSPDFSGYGRLVSEGSLDDFNDSFSGAYPGSDVMPTSL